MNKKLFLGMFAAAGMLLATSCQNDELDAVQSGDEATVSFTLGVEGGVQTRAISDGTSADYLVYAVYDANGELIAPVGSDENKQFVKEDAFTNLKETVSITLAKGQAYTVAFWAQDASCTAYTTTNLENIGISYGGNNNDESRDAFFATTTFTVAGNASIDVTLKRPFAQLNVGVTKEDWDAAKASGLEVKTSSVIVKNAGTELDLLTGKVTEPVEARFSDDDIPNELSMLTVGIDADSDGEVTEEEKKQYHWISMSYILVADNSENGENSATADVCFTFNPAPGTGNPITFEAGLDDVPLQRNWRTNILGKLLTGDVEFNVVIDPTYNNDHNILDDGTESTNEIADGVSYANGVFSVYTAEGLQWISDIVSGSKTHKLVAKQTDRGYFEGQTVCLTQDIDMTGKNFTPIGTDDRKFAGTFDGGNHKISHLKIVGKPEQATVGLFGVANGPIKNVKLSDVDISGYYRIGAIAGKSFDAIKNCTVDRGTITSVPYEGKNGKDAGGIVGHSTADGASGSVKNCTVTDLVITAYRYVGGIAGTAASGAVISTNRVENTTVIADMTASYNETVKNADVGAVVGRNSSSTVSDDNVANGVNVTAINGEEGVYNVESAEDLLAVAAMINSGKDFGSKTIKLTKDIDLSGKNWTPINLWNPEKVLLEEIDGNGKTISNMTVKGASNIGFISETAGSSTLTIKNLAFANPTVETTGSAAGAVIGYQYGDVTLTNVTVSDGNFSTTAEKGISLGGLIGFSAVNDGAKLKLTGCKVENSVFKGYHTISGLVGKITPDDMSSFITECQSNNNTFYYSDSRATSTQHPWSNYYNRGGYNDGTVASDCTADGNVGILQNANGL